MKKTILLISSVCVLTGLTITSCQKAATTATNTVNSLTEFDIPYGPNSFTVPAATTYTASVPVNYATPSFSTNSASIYSQNKTAANLITGVSMTKLNIATSGTNLDYIKSISVYMQASGLKDTLVATKNPVPTGVTNFDTDMTSANLINYISKDQISFRIQATLGGTIATTQTLSLKETVHVKATLIK